MAGVILEAPVPASEWARRGGATGEAALERVTSLLKGKRFTTLRGRMRIWRKFVRFLEAAGAGTCPASAEEFGDY